MLKLIDPFFGRVEPVTTIHLERLYDSPRYQLGEWKNALNCFLDDVASGRGEACLDLSTSLDDAWVSLLNAGDGVIQVKLGAFLNKAIGWHCRHPYRSSHRDPIDFFLSPNDGWLLKRFAQDKRLREVTLSPPDNPGTGVIIRKIKGRPIGVTAYIPWADTI